MAERVMLLGLDSAEWSVVEQYIERGEMPNLGKLVQASTHVRMETPMPYKAEGRWAEFLSGATAEERQYWTINDFDPHSYTPIYARSAHGTYFFSRPDLKTISFDVPNSILAEDAHGIQIFGWGAHAPQFPTSSNPPSILHEIDERFGVHEGMLTDGHHGWHNDTYLDNLHATMRKGIRQRTEIVKWLDGKMPDWDLFTVVYGEAHVALHQYLHGIEPTHPLHDGPFAEGARARIDEIFWDLDEAVGELVEVFGDDTRIVPFAVHGMTTNKSDVLAGVLVPETLHRMTFGEPLLDLPGWSPGDPLMVLDERVLPRHYLESRLRTPTPTTRTGLRALPAKAVRAVRHRLPAERLNDFEKRYWRRPDWWEMNVRPKTPPNKRDLFTEAAWIEMESTAAASWYRTFWPQMRAFVLPSFSDCHIRINLEGRERDGLVPQAEYAAELDRVEALLRSITNPRTGSSIVQEVKRMRDDDPNAEIGPAADLIVSFVEVADVIEHPELGIIGQCPLMRCGEHSRVAWALLPNPDGPKVTDEVYEPRDLPATVLDLLGRAPAPSVTGRSFAHEASQPAR